MKKKVFYLEGNWRGQKSRDTGKMMLFHRFSEGPGHLGPSEGEVVAFFRSAQVNFCVSHGVLLTEVKGYSKLLMWKQDEKQRS